GDRVLPWRSVRSRWRTPTAGPTTATGQDSRSSSRSALLAVSPQDAAGRRWRSAV
ncbi:MAG: hypothetical protein AVDCRST_MAG85-897, partial [uncultured Solirubrobacteraceae bacterium]